MPGLRVGGLTTSQKTKAHLKVQLNLLAHCMVILN